MQKYAYTVKESNNDKDAIFSEIVDRCNKMNASDTLEVQNFGEKKDLFLNIEKDSGYKKRKGKDYNNIVSIVTKKISQDKEEAVDDTGDTYVTDGSLYSELERIWEYSNK